MSYRFLDPLLVVYYKFRTTNDTAKVNMRENKKIVNNRKNLHCSFGIEQHGQRDFVKQKAVNNKSNISNGKMLRWSAQNKDEQKKQKRASVVFSLNCSSSIITRESSHPTTNSFWPSSLISKKTIALGVLKVVNNNHQT